VAEHFDLDIADGVATIALNRQEKLNALTVDTCADLRDALQDLPSEARVVVLTGRGLGFSSGADVEELIHAVQHFGPTELMDFTRTTGSVVRALRDCPLPVIAAVNGIAAGMGAALALASDFRVLAQSATFSFLFTKVGLTGADLGAAYLLPRLIGLARATELLMFGDTVDANRALQLGLATAVVPDDALLTEATKLAHRLTEGPAFTYSTRKSLLTREQDLDLGAAIELEATTQALLMADADHEQLSGPAS
jgi:enoyl-CoA hydratase/carnithine racemase